MTMRTIREATHGKVRLRLLAVASGYLGAVIGDKTGRTSRIEGADADDVWQRLLVEAGKADASYFGFDGAKARFAHFFPQGFDTPHFGSKERDYKLKAKRLLDATLPLDAAMTGTGLAAAARKVFQATDLLAPIEKAKLGDALKSPAGDSFVRAAAAFCQGGGVQALHDMDRLMRPYDSAKWTVVTYLPFLWRPEEHAFLKPDVTKDFATRVGHPFARAYRAQLDYDVYESLLDLVRQTETEIADLHPRDRIDIQSFIWTVGKYQDDTTQPAVPAEPGGKPSR